MLRREFGVSAHEALNVMPTWEIELILRKLREERRAMEEAVKRGG